MTLSVLFVPKIVTMKIVSIVIMSSTLLISCSANDSSEQEIEFKTKSKITEIRENSSDISLVNLSDTTCYKLSELNSVNTHRLTEEELRSEKERIYSLQLSEKYFDWENPTSGGAVHINANDEIEVYSCDMIFDSTQTSYPVSADSLWHLVQGFTWGNSPSVLVTSEINTRKSKSFRLVIENLFKHHPRIFYIEKTMTNIH